MPIWKPVMTKSDFVRRYLAGEFGNASPTWDSLEEMEEGGVLEGSPAGILFHIRNREKGGETWYNVPVETLADMWYEVCEKVPASRLYISEMAPTEKTVFQGEVFYSYEVGLSLFYSEERLPMREALTKKSKSVSGIIALRLIDYYMNPKSVDWLRVLFDRYPDHVVEFSTYSTQWGTLSGYNTVFWEVRKY